MIPVQREDPDLGPPYENCCFCFEETKFWFVEKDVPVCDRCALRHTSNQVPDKELWVRDRARGAH